MNAGDVKTFYRELIDEPDSEFIDESMLERHLEYAYNAFRQFVMQIVPNYYVRRQTLSISTVTGSLDLTTTTPVLAGSSAADGTRIQKIVALDKVSDDDKFTYKFQPVTSAETLDTTVGSFLFQGGTTIHFGTNIDGKIRLHFIPTQNVTWSSSTGYIDDLEAFHDLIALYAARFYSIRDMSNNPQLYALMQQRELDLRQFLGSGGADGMVSEVQYVDY